VTGSTTPSPSTTSQPAPSSTTTTTAPRPTTTTTPPAPPPGTGTYGTVTAGPTCPVERPDQPCPPQPVSAQIDAQDSTGRVAGTTHSDSQGRYTLPLPPGDYTLNASTGNSMPRCQPVKVTVTSGSPTRADISCDTGIR
jgi:hypothetical protein